MDEVKEICDERFERDRERLDKLEDNTAETSRILAKAWESHERVNKQLDDHENRLRESERKPSALFDKIVSALISALVAGFVVYLTKGGA